MQQDTIARQVLEKTDAQTCPLRCSLDQTRYIRHYKTAVRLHFDHTEVGHQGGKRVIGNLWPCRRHGAYEGRFAGIGQPQQANVCQDLQFELEGPLLSLTAG